MKVIYKTDHYFDYPEDLAQALDRADVYYYENVVTNTLHMVSQNLDAPLTDREKQRIRTYLNLRSFFMNVAFDI